MNEVQKHISFGIGRKNQEKVEHEIFDDSIWDSIPILASLKDKAAAQLGTVGGGNHYVDIFTDELNRIWVGVHFGSRGLGHSIGTHGKTNRKTGKQLTEGLVKRDEHDAWMKRAGVELRGGDLDESPYAYKRIENVLEAHKGTINILHTLKPVGVVMADSRENDPYKD